MGLDFKIKDFAYPISILKFKKRFDRNQFLEEEDLRAYQLKRLKVIIDHAYKNVPYYKELFRKNGLIPSDIKTLHDLRAIPFLTKATLQTSYQSLIAKNAKVYLPRLITTSGTTGGQVRLYMDKPSNVLEFVYYWRSWGWAGYKIGDTFAELSAQHFTPYKNKGNSLCHFEHISRRLLVNSLLMSRDRVGDYIRVFKRFRPLFLKGLSSNLYILALLFGERDNHGIHFKAIFSQGENLLNYQREMIEKVFSCKIYDAYGHMERTIAISQCPAGSYHVHSDYGLAEFLETGERFPAVVSEDEYIAEAIGTGLYNFSMPLIRYKSGDYVKISRFPQKCPCGREFPTIISILGRESDVVITPDGRAITALYVALDRTPGITFGQIIQETRDRLLVKVSCELEDEKSLDKLLLSNLKDFIGETMVINIVHVSPDVIPNATPGKFKSIISNVASATILN